MTNVMQSGVVLMALTMGIYLLGIKAQRKTGLVILNPILITVAVMIALLTACGISYDTYLRGGQFIDFWLKPAVVALGVPLYKQLESIKKQMLPLLLAEVAGCVAGIISVVLIARLLGASDEVLLSLAPKAVTTPIAIEVSQAINGIPALTAAVVVCTGIFGAMFGFSMVSISGVRSRVAGSLGIGTASHAVGTSACMARSGRYGAYSSLGLILNGLLTALLAPYLLPIIGL